MGNYFKIKKRRIIVTFLLVFNQLLLSSSYALGNRKLEINELDQNNLTSKYGRKSEIFTSKKRNKTNPKKGEEELEKFAEEIDKFVTCHGRPCSLSISMNGSGSNCSMFHTPASFHMPLSISAAPIIAGTPVV